MCLTTLFHYDKLREERANGIDSVKGMSIQYIPRLFVRGRLCLSPAATNVNGYSLLDQLCCWQSK